LVVPDSDNPLSVLAILSFGVAVNGNDTLVLPNIGIEYVNGPKDAGNAYIGIGNGRLEWVLYFRGLKCQHCA